MTTVSKYLFVALIIFSFIAPFFSRLSYTFCPANPEMGFICYCVYKGDKAEPKKQDIVYSAGVKKQLEAKSFNGIIFSTEDGDISIFYKESEPLILEYRFLYSSIPSKAPDRPT